jgi:small GTP-binding protein
MGEKSTDYYLLKLIIIGDSGVGKSSLAENFVYNRKAANDTLPTIGVEFYPYKVEHNEKNFKLQIWDTAGQEKFKSIAKSYYRDATGALICFSLADIESFCRLQNHINDFCSTNNKNDESVAKLLVGTFADIEDPDITLDKNMIQKFADKNNMKFIAISSKTGENVKECFNILLDEISTKIDDDKIKLKTYGDDVYKLEDITHTKTGYCCY